MALINMVMPSMGESIMECTVIQWLKQPGDRIEADESVLEVATDKVDTEVPASETGVLVELLVQAGDVVAIGAPVARIDTEVAAQTRPVSTSPAPPAATPLTEVVPLAVATQPEASDQVAVAYSLEASISAMSSRPAPAETPIFADRFYSPLVLNIAKEESVSRPELDRIPGTGVGGRLTKKDILTYVMDRVEGNLHSPANSTPKSPKSQAHSPQPTPVRSLNGQNDIIQMDRMRKLIAQRMVESKQISPHVTSFVEADMTGIVQWRTAHKEKFQQETGENLTFMPLLIQAVVKAIHDFPLINSSVEGDTIVVKKTINIGMAVALPSGNLIVPVIHDAGQYNLAGLTKRINDLTRRARANKLTADDLAGGTYTVSNIGTFGNLMGTPIIVQPQVAIMAFGAIVKKPAVIETPQGDLLGIRQLMFLSHSYDHRVIDGSLGGQFVRRVADYLEQFDTTQKP